MALQKSSELATGDVIRKARTVNVDEGPRPDTSLEGLAKLKPVFAAKGSVTAGNSSQTSDGAGALILASEKAVKQFDADIGAYQTCLETEHNDALAKEGDKLTEDQKKERARVLAQKQNAAADEAQQIADRFNEQVKVYREKNKKQ